MATGLHSVTSLIVRAAIVALLWSLALGASAQTVRYIHTDALGSVAVMTDQNRNVIERREYEPYGLQLTPAIKDGPGYTGHVQDAVTGLTYMQQRYYDPSIGRFLSVDPVEAYSDPAGAFNRYWYANNNPYRFTDPDGRQSFMAYYDAYMRHYYRNALNSPPANKGAAQSSSGWRQLSAAQSAFHRQGKDGARNTKWVDQSGHHEAVYDEEGDLVTDSLNGGTYNYAPPDDWTNHTKYDVLPYFLWGNGPIVVSSPATTTTTPTPTPTVIVGGPVQVDDPLPPPPPPPPETD
jgi:RHS repeat-associated protein